LEILETLRHGLSALIAHGKLQDGALPFLTHLMDVALDDAPVSIPYTRFFKAPHRP
jgi:hypothetical protein